MAQHTDPGGTGAHGAAQGHHAMGEQQRETLRRAIRLEWITIAWVSATVVLVGLVAGQSLGMGTYLAISSAMGLIRVERPPAGLMVIFGQPIWTGWLMIAVMVVTSPGPVVLGRMKKRLAEDLHDKVLSADGDMGSADWRTAIATVVGVLGIGIGWWWADAVAAIIVSVSIIKDGVHNLWSAIAGLTATEARTVDGSEPHPLTLEVEQRALAEPWVADASARVRDLGHVLHVELFVAPHAGIAPQLEQLEALHRRVCELDWKVDDVVVVPCSELPSSQTFRSTLRD